jgi:hypothetical protein
MADSFPTPPPLTRRPRGYVGLSHLTLGSVILAVLQTVLDANIVLGEKRFEELRAVQPQRWYPVATMLDLLEFLAKRMGRASLVKMGRQLFKNAHARQVGSEANSAGDILFGMDTMYRHANTGESIGVWRVLKFSPGLALVEKTTPHHCGLEEGILHEALSLVGAESLIVHRQCFRDGAESCIFEIHSSAKGVWMGKHSPK